MRFPPISVRFEFKSISMVKQRCSFMNRTTTLDLLKLDSPKVRDDPFGYLSPRIASDFSDRSDLLGVSPDSPEITHLKSCDGSCFLRLASNVLDLADFLQISLTYLDCFDITTASMVFTLKIERCTSQTSLYVWSSFLSGFIEFNSPRGEILDDDILFGQIPWLNLKLELMFIYGSLPRPPDVRYIVVCMCFLTLLSRSASNTLNVVDCGVLWRYLANRNALREGELRLDGLMHFLDFEIDEEWLILLVEHCVFSSPSSQFQDLVCSSQECANGVGTKSDIGRALCYVDEILHLELLICESVITMMMTSRRLRVLDSPISDMLNGLCTTEVLVQILKYIDADVVQISFEKADSVCDSRDYSGLGPIVLVVMRSLEISNPEESGIPRPSHFAKVLVEFYGCFGTLKTIIFGSLPRPPEIFGSSLINFYEVFKSKIQVPYILRGSIRV